MIHVTALERSLCRPLRGWREGGRAYPRAAPRVSRGWPWATACRPSRGWKRGQSMSQGGSYRGRRGEGPMQKQDVVLTGSRLLVWDRRPRRSGVRGRCGTGALAPPCVGPAPSPVGSSWAMWPRRISRPALGTSPPEAQQSDTAPTARNIPTLAEGQGNRPPRKNPTGLKARTIVSRRRWVPNMFRAFSPLACFECHHLALQARLVCYAPLALKRGKP